MNPNLVNDGKGEPDGLPFFVGSEPIVGEYPSTRYRKYFVAVIAMAAALVFAALMLGTDVARVLLLIIGPLALASMATGLSFELLAPRRIRVEGSELIAEWSSKAVRWPLRGLRTERTIAEMVLEPGSTRISNGTDGFWLFPSLTNLDRIVEIVERARKASR